MSVGEYMFDPESKLGALAAVILIEYLVRYAKINWLKSFFAPDNSKISTCLSALPVAPCWSTAWSAVIRRERPASIQSASHVFLLSLCLAGGRSIFDRAVLGVIAGPVYHLAFFFCFRFEQHCCKRSHFTMCSIIDSGMSVEEFVNGIDGGFKGRSHWWLVNSI